MFHGKRGMVALWCALGGLAPAGAQTRAVVYKADTALLIFKAKQCTRACDSTLLVEWRYGGSVFHRVVAPRASDTVRTARLSVRDSAYPSYVPIKRLAMAPVEVLGYTAPVPLPTPPIPAPVGAGVSPALPGTFAIPYPALSGVTIRVNAGGDLQGALNVAKPGDEIVLANGATFTGNFVLPAKSGAAWVVVRCEEVLPAGRVAPGNPCATIRTPNTEPAIRTAAGASHWRLVGLQITHAPVNTAQNYGLVVLGRGDETSVASMPSDIVLDRVQVRGDTNVGNSRCVAFNGVRLALVDSHITECHAKGQDAQGVGGWNGPGPFLIENNRIEASGQGVMFGGADPRIRDVLPSDITITRNYLYKPLSWGGGKWTVKAAFELKNAKRVLFEGNVIENHWADAQVGFAMLLQTLADNNTSHEWTTVQDVTLRNNLIRNSTSGVNILARVAYNGGVLPTHPTSRVLLLNNAFENVGRDPISGAAGTGVQLLSDLIDVTVANNTFTCGCVMQKALSFDGKPQTRTNIVDNVFGASHYVLTGNATGPGKRTLDVFMPGGVFLRNTLPGAQWPDYPPNALGNGAGVNRAQLDAALAGVRR